MSKEKTESILIIGVGNSGRSDDAMGWLVLNAIEDKFPSIKVMYRYQLQVEDAELISHYNTVIFIDATKEKTNKGFFFKSCIPMNHFSFSSHSLDPETVLWLENDLFHTLPATFVMGIEGYTWALSNKTSEKGISNMEKAKTCLFNNVYRIIKNKAPICCEK